MEKPLRKEIRLQWVHCNFPHYYTIFNLQLVREKLCALQQQFLLLDSSPSPTQCAACSCSPAKSAMYFPLLLCSVFDSLGSALHNKLRNWSVALLMELLAVPSPVYLPRTADSSSATLCSLFFFIVKNAASQKLIDFANQVALQLGAGWSVESHYLVLTLTFSAPQQPPTDMQPDQRMPRTWGVRHKLGRTFRDNLSYQSVQYTIYAWWSIIKNPKWC